MKKLASTLILSLIALPLFAAADMPAPEAAPAASPEASPTASPAEQIPVLEVKNKSSFVLDESSRNPFWPIGWKPAAKQTTATNESAGPQILPTAFHVSSITVDQGGRFAIINGKAMTEGQVFGLQMGNQTYQITVKAIQDGQVVLLRRDQEIPVPLHRR
jgi:hypothetical protein